ncbi:hypothetical protein FQN49_005302, partial [Arthroderma sp. PD_2]
LGLGAPIPQKEADGSIKRTELSSNDKLRKQLLGKNFRKSEASGLKNASSRIKQTAPAQSQAEMAEDSEEDGRSSLGKGKRKGNTENQSSASNADSGTKKRTGSYLDEVLSQRKPKKGRK